MDFNFLPNLPKSNLDDRQFQDLVDECLLRIPRYCPEWTNHNPSDPGITLVELFAWMTDLMLERFNQVPRRNYVTFLELLGVRLRPPAPAKTEVTFYLSTTLPEPYTIPQGAEVATLRTEDEDAIIFSTDKSLTIGTPQIRHVLTAPTAEREPQMLRDRLVGSWRREANGNWQGLEFGIFDNHPQPGNCLYLVFDASDAIAGNVIAVTVKGDAATATGINPDQPPRRWEAWTGQDWQPILLADNDDKTQGFSFSELVRQGGDPLSGADIILHLPQSWPASHFFTYQGRWLRCLYSQPTTHQPGYLRSPRIMGITARSLGGTVTASQSTLITHEFLADSDGNPGQTRQLPGVPVLPRRHDECLQVTPPGGTPQIWQEVDDFSQSGPDDRHYTLDSLTGQIQFGPLIRQPNQRQDQHHWRSRSPSGLSSDASSSLTPPNHPAQGRESLEKQYGAVPSRGASLQMLRYRTGGGLRGNVQARTIRIVKSAIPYVAAVINHRPGRGGANSESLDEAAIRVPQRLRTRDRAVTVEDFETLSLDAAAGALARSRCLPPTHPRDAGSLRLLLVPNADTQAIEQGRGIHPQQFQLSESLIRRVLNDLDERRLLGVQIHCDAPDYRGVAVQAEVALKPDYQTPSIRQELIATLQVALYRFLNPITGGPEGSGWPFGRPVYPSDIVTIAQSIPGILYLGSVQLFELRYDQGHWQRSLPADAVINPGPLGLICSWRDDALRSGHTINLL